MKALIIIIASILGSGTFWLTSSFKPLYPKNKSAAVYETIVDELAPYRMQHNRDKVDKSRKLNEIVETQICLIELSK